jgi:hypothetical protein
MTTENKFTNVSRTDVDLNETTSRNSMLDHFTNINRFSDYNTCKNAVDEMMNSYKNMSDLIDIFSIWAYKRGCHGEGEGNRDVSYYILLTLYSYFPKTVCYILRNQLYSVYGYWKDYVSLIKIIHKIARDTNLTQSEEYKLYDPIVRACRDTMLKQRSDDIKLIGKWTKRVSGGKSITNYTIDEFQKLITEKMGSNAHHNISLVGKYLVNEKSADNDKAYWYIGDYSTPKKIKHVSYFIRSMLKSVDEYGKTVKFVDNYTIPFNIFKSYRQLNAKLRSITNTVEQLMCSNKWDNIEASNIPSVAKFKMRKAFLNEKIKIAPKTPEEEQTGNRYPNNISRINCRNNMRIYITNNNNIKMMNVMEQPLLTVDRVHTMSQENIFRRIMDNTEFFTPLLNVLKKSNEKQLKKYR